MVNLKLVPGMLIHPFSDLLGLFGPVELVKKLSEDRIGELWEVRMFGGQESGQITQHWINSLSDVYVVKQHAWETFTLANKLPF